MKNHYLIIDIGTGNSRVVLADSQGCIICAENMENSYIRDTDYIDSHYFLPEQWSQLILSLCKKVISQYPNIHINAITSSGCRQHTVFFNARQEAFYGIPNMDRRGREYIGELSQKDMLYKTTGKWVSNFPVANMYAIKQKKPELYKQIAKLTSVGEWVGYLFTKKICIEPSLAGETAAYDIAEKKWSDEVLAVYGINKNLFPDTQNSMTQLGLLDKSVKDFLDLSYDIPFVVGGADTQCAILGAGGQVGDITVISGTTTPIFYNIPEFYHDPQKRCWVDLNLCAKDYFIETNPGITGLNYQNFKNKFFPDISYPELDKTLRKMQKPKVIASFTTLRFDKGEPLKHGGFFSRPPFNSDLTREDYAAAIGADIVCAVYWAYQVICTLVSHQKDYIRGCGGGFRTGFVSQAFADLTGKNLILGENFSQSSVLGGIQICNTYLGLKNTVSEENSTVYTPSANSFIHEYFAEWKHYREMLTQN